MEKLWVGSTLYQRSQNKIGKCWWGTLWRNFIRLPRLRVCATRLICLFICPWRRLRKFWSV
jgi:hypothetical protein